MQYFLVVYDRSDGEIRQLRAFDDHAEALDERFRLERTSVDPDNTEIVVLGAPDEASLRKTHNRYFARTVGDLVG